MEAADGLAVCVCDNAAYQETENHQPEYEQPPTHTVTQHTCSRPWTRLYELPKVELTNAELITWAEIVAESIDGNIYRIF